MRAPLPGMSFLEYLFWDIHICLGTIMSILGLVAIVETVAQIDEPSKIDKKKAIMLSGFLCIIGILIIAVRSCS